MDNKEEFVNFWDEKVNPLVMRCCEIVNPVDKHAKCFIGSMGAAVEHDIADGRILGLGGFNTMMQVKGCLNDDEYYKYIHNNIDNDETKLLKELGNTVKEGIDILLR